MNPVVQITLFSLGTAALGTLSIIIPGVFSGWLLARKKWPGKALVETLITLPLVVPPVATGLILLKLFGRHGAMGAFLQQAFGIEIIFTWKAVVLATAVMSFPLLVRTAKIAFAEVNHSLEETARTLGAKPCDVFFSITLPLARRGVLSGIALAFARALGEFGATAMVAGLIPGKTMTLALGIYQHVQLGEDNAALLLLIISLALAFGAVWVSERLQRGTQGSA